MRYTPTANTPATRRLFKNRFWISLVLTVPVVLSSLQNLVWATGYNVLAVPLAAGVLAFAGFVLSPAAGAVLMGMSTIVVALNAQLLRRIDLSPERIRT